MGVVGKDALAIGSGVVTRPGQGRFPALVYEPSLVVVVVTAVQLTG